VMTWAVRIQLDRAGERLPSTVALQGATLQPASKSERLTCAAENGGRAAWTRTGEIQTAVAVGIRVGPHERGGCLRASQSGRFYHWRTACGCPSERRTAASTLR
jgi:hypothetical protein